jgi:hypothetical protein
MFSKFTLYDAGSVSEDMLSMVQWLVNKEFENII